MLRWVFLNLRTFLLALVLAISVWVMAVTSSDPDETNTLPTPIPIEYIGQDIRLIAVSELPATTQVTLRAPKSVWDKILSNPQSVRAVVDMSGLAAGVHTVEIVVQVSARPVKVVSLVPSSVTFTLEPVVSRRLPVEIELIGETGLGYQAGQVASTIREATISGPESPVMRVAKVKTTLDISNARADIEARLPLLAVDENGLPVPGVTITPSETTITLPIVRLGGYRDVAVKVITVGRPANGYRLASIAVFPPIVTVYSGNPAIVENLPGYIETLPLNLNGANQNIETRLQLALPADVTLLGNPDVLVQVSILPIESSLTISSRPVEVQNLGPGLKVSVSPTTVDVIVSGPLPLLETLRATDVKVSVDVKGLKAGSYQLTPTVTILLNGLTLESILPGSILVTLANTSP
ncbi:MAG: CdaR family protein [Anaerolineales bacterium]|nr:CdaR family protein [Anaerolineales bacterium]MCX7608271.1 CdaR family protein [Anaerolineales bacterium]